MKNSTYNKCFGPFFDKSGKNSGPDFHDTAPTKFFGPFFALRPNFRPLGNTAQKKHNSYFILYTNLRPVVIDVSDVNIEL
jgi:hypothetical protein